MTDERVVDEIVSKCLLNTCRLRPLLCIPVVIAAGRCAASVSNAIDDTEAESIPQISGSTAEFYIEPLIPHIGDVDVMYHWSTQLAIPQGHPVHHRQSYPMGFTTMSGCMR